MPSYSRHAPFLHAGLILFMALAVAGAAAFGGNLQTGSLALAAFAGWGTAALARDVWTEPRVMPSALRALSSMGAVLVCLVILVGVTIDATGLRLLVSVFAVALICDLTAGLLGGQGRHAIAVFVGVVALSFAPIWAGHLLVAAPEVQDAVLWVNPIAQLFVQAGIDPFRTELFYGHSPVGDLRYNLPHKDTALIAQFFLVALLSGALALRGRGRP